MTNCLHVIGIGIKPDGTRYDMPCKQWRCPVCARILKNKLMNQVNLYFRDEPNVYFYTFTEQADSGRDIMKDLEHFRNTLYRGLKERVPHTFNEWTTRWAPYPKIKAFYVKEFTKRGIRHVHMITNIEMSNEELTQRWRHATRGISDQARITDTYNLHSPAGYMMKYMAKQLDTDQEYFYTGEYQFKKHERRTGFWKPEDVISVPTLDWEEAPDPEDQIEIEIGHHWNQDSRYWRSWYDDLYHHWGEPFHNFMENSTLNEIQRASVQAATIQGEISYDYVPEDQEIRKPGELTKMWLQYRKDHPHTENPEKPKTQREIYLERIKNYIDPW